jgi:hypothetical protein
MPKRSAALRIVKANTLIKTYCSRLKQIDEAKATADYAQTASSASRACRPCPNADRAGPLPISTVSSY